MMRMCRGADRVDGDLHVAVGAVLEADGARQARSHLTMHLALGRARADRAPRDEVREVLRRDDVEKFTPRGQPERVDLPQQLARDAQALVDREAAVEMRVVDESLPADRSARFL